MKFSLKMYKRPIFIGFIAGIGVMIGISFFADIRNVKDVFLDFNLSLLPIIMALAPINYILRFFKWNYFLKKLSLYPNPEINKYIFMSGLSMTVTPGKMGELLKCYLLKEHIDAPISTTSPIVMAERLTDAMAMILLASFGALAFNYGKYALMITFLALLILVLTLQFDSLFTGGTSVLARFPLTNRFSSFVVNFQQASKKLYSLSSLVVTVGLGVVSWGFEGLVIFITIQAFGGEISLLNSFFVVSLSAILGGLSFIPGGLGVAEGSIMALLILTGVGKEVAAASTIITRISTLWLGVFIGLIGLIRIEKLLFQDRKQEEI